MKARLIILVLLLVPIANIFHSCRCKEQHINYFYNSLLLENLDNSGAEVIESEALQFNKNAYGIRLILLKEERLIVRAKQVNSIFVQSAYAVSWKCPYTYSAVDTIVSIKVFTINDFDNLHSENSEITEYFKVRQTYSSVKDHVVNINRPYKSYDMNNDIEIDLMLMTVPTINNRHQFKVRIELSNGHIFEEQTTEIELL
ncbi:MAG: DUF5034 domain-containing protein [Bacteroidales bacterium]|nr:DUF5034 domain-containing protein [Bacteroidales bacterium]